MPGAADTNRAAPPAGAVRLDGAMVAGAVFFGAAVRTVHLELADGRTATIQLPAPAPAAAPADSDVTADILDAVAKLAPGARLRGKEVAELCDRPFDSYFRAALARLADPADGRIVKDANGYGPV